MKKILIIGLFMLMFNAVSANAANGDVIGNIYSTDIIAEINGEYVESYCLDGKTAIILEDLAKHGAEISYNDKLRTLIVNTVYMNKMVDENIKRGTVGKVIGNIYESDIKVYLNGYIVRAFSLNGKMAVAIEDFGNDNSFSKYNAKYIWNDTNRIISLEILTDNFSEIKASDNIGFKLYAEGENLQIEINKFADVFSNSVRVDEPKSLFYDGKKIAECFSSKYAKFENGDIVIEDLKNLVCFDIPAITDAINSMDRQPTYNEVIKHIEENYLPVGTVYDRIDTDEYTFIYMVVSLRDGGHEALLRIDKEGNFTKYHEQFKSVSYNGSRKFENLLIDKNNETVSFHYDYDYIIDLKTGTMTRI